MLHLQFPISAYNFQTTTTSIIFSLFIKHISYVVLVMIQFLFGFILFMRLAGITLFLPQFCALYLATLLNLGHSLPSKKSSLFPFHLYFSGFCGHLSFLLPLTSSSKTTQNTITSSSQPMSVSSNSFCFADSLLVLYPALIF